MLNFFSQKSNAFENNHGDEWDIGGIYVTFLEKKIRPKYIHLVQSVQSYHVYRNSATSARQFSAANAAVV